MGFNARMINRQTLAEQTATHLIREMNAGRWRGELPGVNRLSVELGVSRETVRAALGLVERQGLLQTRGMGRARSILTGGAGEAVRESLRVMVLLHDPSDRDSSIGHGLLNPLKVRLDELGHHCVFATQSQSDLGMDANRIIRMVERAPADAWVVVSGSLELLQWFSTGSVPAIAVGGRTIGLPIASASRKALPAYREVFQSLVEMGHRRIVMLSPKERRLPFPSAIELCFQEELTRHGVPFSNYNIPDWEPTPEGLDVLLTSLFRVTPPTVLQVGNPGEAVAVLAWLGRRGLRVPEDVSLICELMDNTLAWHRPAIAHFTVDFEFIARRIIRWVKAVADGKIDLKQAACLAKFDAGGSIMPPQGK